jgi:antitoxin YefM
MFQELEKLVETIDDREMEAYDTYVITYVRKIMGLSLTAFRQNLYKYVKEVLADETGSLRIKTKQGDVELVNAAEIESLREFHHLFSSPANAKRLMQSIENTRKGDVVDVSLEKLRKLVEEN